MKKNHGFSSKKTKPIQSQFVFLTAENAELAEEKGCNLLQNKELQSLSSQRSSRPLRLMRYAGNQSQLPAFGRKSEALSTKLVLSEVEWIRNKTKGCGMAVFDSSIGETGAEITDFSKAFCRFRQEKEVKFYICGSDLERPKAKYEVRFTRAIKK